MVKVQKIFVQGEDGQTYTVDKEWMRQYLGICNLNDKLKDIMNRLNILEKPLRMQHILDVLKAEGKPRSSAWLYRHIPYLDWMDVVDLERDGKIYHFKSGFHIMWQLATVGR